MHQEREQRLRGAGRGGGRRRWLQTSTARDRPAPLAFLHSMELFKTRNRAGRSARPAFAAAVRSSRDPSQRRCLLATEYHWHDSFSSRSGARLTMLARLQLSGLSVHLRPPVAALLSGNNPERDSTCKRGPAALEGARSSRHHFMSLCGPPSIPYVNWALSPHLRAPTPLCCALFRKSQLGTRACGRLCTLQHAVRIPRIPRRCSQAATARGLCPGGAAARCRRRRCRRSPAADTRGSSGGVGAVSRAAEGAQ